MAGMRRALLPAMLALLAAALLAGCGGGDEEAAEPQPPQETAETAPAETVPPETAAEADPTVLRVYLMRGEHLGVGARRVDATGAPGGEAIRALLEGPTPFEQEAGLSSEIPDGTELNSLAIDDGHAVVDLSREFESGGGSLSMQARVAQVVHTLTQFPTVERVSIRLDGDDVDAIGGEGVPARELTRADFEDLAPAILVESPAPGDRVTSPLRIQGTANTFEATFQVEIVDGDGRIVHEGFVTATSGSGERGLFDETFRFEGAEGGMGALIVWEESAASPPEGPEDGRLHLVEIPLEFAP